MRQSLIALILFLPLPIFAAANKETLQYIIADYQEQCEKVHEDFRDVDYKDGDPVVSELGLAKDDIYEITIDKDGKTATVLHAAFTCTNVGRSWCGSGGCDTYMIVDGVSYTSWGWKPVSVQVGDSCVALAPRSQGACHNSL